jgi:hypothetical protein
MEIIWLVSMLQFVMAGFLAALSFLASMYPDVGLQWQDYILKSKDIVLM